MKDLIFQIHVPSYPHNEILRRVVYLENIEGLLRMTLIEFDS
jgi:hypothetical protein